jgi:transposase-like protein
LARDFSPAEPDQVWSGDITYIATDEGWLYLAAVIDLFSRQVVGWSMQPHMQASLVTDALRMAWFRRHPSAGLIFHSDRGSQYCSDMFQDTLSGYGMRSSMSRRGNCWDNAPTESLWGSLKVGRLHGRRFATRREAMDEIIDWLTFYVSRHLSTPFLPTLRTERLRAHVDQHGQVDMTKEYAELKARLVVGQKRDGRNVYDEGAKQELIVACLKPGISVARMALEHGVNTNLLRTWIAAHQRSARTQSTIVAPTGDEAFVAVHVEANRDEVQSVSPREDVITVPAVVRAPAMPVVVIPDEASLPPPTLMVGLQVRLPNGVEFDLSEASLQELSSLVQMLDRLPCSSSTKS